MQARSVIFSLLLVLVVLGIVVSRIRHEPAQREAFDRTPDKLNYTRHAKCRMDCRGISRDDVEEIMAGGIINFNKSDRNDRPCPSFALQGETSDGEKIRVIFAQCPTETRVVTCYHLDRESPCSCPGDAGYSPN